MSLIQVELSTDQLLQAVEQLSQQELETFVAQVLRLRAQRKAPSLSANETQLLLKINQAIPEAVQTRFDELVTCRRALALTDAEHTELLQLTDQIEQYDAERIEALGQLAQRRGKTLPEIIEELAIQPPACV